MPTTEFSFRELNGLLGKNFRPEELRDRMPMLGVDIEGIDEDKVVMEVFPNRPDMLGVEGFARAFRGFIGMDKGLCGYSAKGSDVKVCVDGSVKEVRPYIAAGIVKGVSFTEESLVSLMNIQEKLHVTHGRNRMKVAIGVHDMSRVEAPFTYKAVKPDGISFVPLDMSKEMDLAGILLDHPKGREYAWTLEGRKRYPVILDCKGNVLSFPPIINGELTRVCRDTKDIFIEVTGTCGKAVNQALNILVTSVLERGGKAYTVEIIEK